MQRTLRRLDYWSQIATALSFFVVEIFDHKKFSTSSQLLFGNIILLTSIKWSNSLKIVNKTISIGLRADRPKSFFLGSRCRLFPRVQRRSCIIVSWFLPRSVLPRLLPSPTVPMSADKSDILSAEWFCCPAAESFARQYRFCSCREVFR